MLMKKILISFGFLLAMLFSASGQDLIYRPFRSGGGSSNTGQYSAPPTTKRQHNYTSQPSSTIVRATAIYTTDGTNYYKVPILVQMNNGTNHYGGTSYYVISEWRSNGYGGQWQNLSLKAYVEVCNSLNAYGSSAELEKSYMYKARVGNNVYYFDL